MSYHSFTVPTERRPYFIDTDGNLTYTKREDEVVTRAINWGPQLYSGESISSVAYEDHGVTRSSTSNTGNVTTTSVTGTGYFEVTVTLSSGRKLQRVVRFVSTEGAGPSSDYR